MQAWHRAWVVYSFGVACCWTGCWWQSTHLLLQMSRCPSVHLDSNCRKLTLDTWWSSWSPEFFFIFAFTGQIVRLNYCQQDQKHQIPAQSLTVISFTHSILSFFPSSRSLSSSLFPSPASLRSCADLCDQPELLQWNHNAGLKEEFPWTLTAESTELVSLVH